MSTIAGESSEGIDEELKKIDGLKSEELIDEEEEVALLNGEGLSQTSCEEKVSTDLKSDGNTSEIEKEKHEDSDEPQKENTAPVSSSRYDVELEEDIWIDGNCDTQTSEVCKLEDKTENSEIEKVKTILSAKTKEMTDIPLSQTSDMSENDAWTVIDSVETSEDEEKQSQEKKIELEPENDSEEMIVSSTVTDNEVSETTQTKGNLPSLILFELLTNFVLYDKIPFNSKEFALDCYFSKILLSKFVSLQASQQKIFFF